MRNIDELRSIRAKIKELQRQETELCTPKLKDLSLIKSMYDIFCQTQASRDIPISGTYQRGKFIYLVILLYSPKTLAGDKTTQGVNKILSELFKIKSRTVISTYISNTCVFYDSYKDFREDVELLYEKTTRELCARGLI